MTPRTVGAAATLLAALATALVGVLAKEALRGGDSALDVLTARYVCAGLVLAVPVLIIGRPRSAFVTRRRMLLLGLAATAMCFGGIAEFEALARLPLPVVIVIVFISPAWVAFYSRLVRGERIGSRRLLAFGGVICGITLVVGVKWSSYDPFGVLCALGSSVILAGFLILADELVDLLGPLTAMGMTTFGAGLLAFAITPGAPARTIEASGTLPDVIGVGLLSAAAFLFLSAGLERGHVFDISVIGAAEPLFVTVLAALTLGENLSALQVFGGALVVLGVVALATAPVQHPRPVWSPG